MITLYHTIRRDQMYRVRDQFIGYICGGKCDSRDKSRLRTRYIGPYKVLYNLCYPDFRIKARTRRISSNE